MTGVGFFFFTLTVALPFKRVAFEVLFIFPFHLRSPTVPLKAHMGHHVNFLLYSTFFCVNIISKLPFHHFFFFFPCDALCVRILRSSLWNGCGAAALEL